MLYVNSFIRTFVGAAIALFIFSHSIGFAAGPSRPPIASHQPVPAVYPIKSYREWKSSMIGESEIKVKTLKENFLKTRTAASQSATEAGVNLNLQNIQYMLDKEELQLSLAQDLSISDYFVGYLTKQKSLNSAIKEVSGRLTADEVAELMTAYANNFFSSLPAPTIQAPRADSGL